MNRKIIAIALSVVMALSLAACGGGEETTLTGMVTAVNGTVVSVADMGEMNFEGGERPQMDLSGVDPESFAGTLPEGETYPARGDGEMPQMPADGEMPEFDGELPEGMTMPADGEMPEFDGELPEGMTMPADGEMPDFGGMGGGMFAGFSGDMETTDVDIADAHISVEIDGGKASGSLEEIQPGVFVTITMNGKGEVTNVLISSQSGFGGMGRGQNG